LRLRINNQAPWSTDCLLVIPLLIIAFFPLSVQAETPFEASQQFIETGQQTEARRALETEIRMRPNNVTARYNLAILLQQSGHHSDAIKLYRENLTFVWHLPSLVNLASALQTAGATAEAEQWLLKGTKKLRHEATPWYMLAAISEQQNSITKATTQYRKALKTDPLNGFAYLHYAAFQSRHKLADHGLKHAAKAIRLLPDCAPCWYKYGDILHSARKDDDALIAYQRSLAIDPNTETRQQLVGTLRLLGFHQRADQMQRGMDMESKDRAGK